MSISIEMDLRTAFKTFYCKNCGTKLVKKRQTRIADKDETDNFNKEMFPTGIPMKSKLKVISWFFVCPSCNNATTTKEQLEIRKQQKRLKSKILTK